MSAPVHVLVTGSSGRVGRAVVAELLRRHHRVRGLDRAPSSALAGADSVVADLTDRPAIDAAMRGIDCLIHLAATPDDDDVLTQIVPNNIVGLFHVMDAARAAGVKRIVLPSSGQVNWWQQMREDVPIRATDPTSPKYWYAATKMFMEAIGYGFVEAHGISVIVARLGWCPRTRAQVEEIAAAEWAQDIYLSPEDAGRFFACCVEAPATLRHAIVYAASRHIHRQRFDMSEASTLLGYEPRQAWPQGIEVVDDVGT